MDGWTDSPSKYCKQYIGNGRKHPFIHGCIGLGLPDIPEGKLEEGAFIRKLSASYSLHLLLSHHFHQVLSVSLFLLFNPR
jgi:hypothetical protein